MADQQRGDSLYCDGVHKSARTPNLDWLASEGIVFHRGYSSTPSCTPARAAILTGLSPWNHGMIGFAGIREEFPYEMPRAFTQGGYITHAIGKAHFGWNRSCDCPYTHGFQSIDLYEGLPEIFDDYEKWLKKVRPDITDELITGLGWNDYRAKEYALDEYLHPTVYVGRRGVEFIEEYNSTKPFLLKVSWHRPHAPYDPPRRLSDTFKETEMPLPWLGDEWDEIYNTKWAREEDIPAGIIQGNIGLKLTLRTRRFYWAAVTHVDEWVGKVIDALRKRNFLDNTLIVYTADHGDMLGDHYHWRKCTPYEGSARIPMIFRWPRTWDSFLKYQRGSFLYNPVELRDLFPTFLDAARIPVPKSIKLDGQSFILFIDDKLDQCRIWLDLEHDNCYGPLNRWNAGTDGHWKYVFRATVNEELLFNLDKDPEERFNLAGRPESQEIIKLWRSRIIQQFIRERRGESYVSNNTLVQRDEGRTFSPHYDKPVDLNIYWKPSNPEEETLGFIPRTGDDPNEGLEGFYSLTNIFSISPRDSSKTTSLTTLIEIPKVSTRQQFNPKLFYFVISTLLIVLFIKRKTISGFFPMRKKF